MLETLQHFSATSAAGNPFPKPPHIQSNHPNSFPPISRRRNIHFSSSSSTSSSTICLPPKPPISPEIITISQPPSAPAKPNSEFQEKLVYLDSIGIDFFSLLSSHPPIVSTSISSIKSTITLLFSVGLTTQDLRRAVAMCPEILTAPSSSIVPVLTFLLREANVDGRNLRHVIHRRPRLLTCSVEFRLRPTLYFLQSTIGICEVSKVTHLLSSSVESKLIPRIDYFQNLGFSYKDVIVMFRRFPSLFCYSVKENLEVKFNYFVVEMGRDLKELKEFPHYFSFSLENRIKPRHKQCVEKGVCLSLPLMLKSREDRFQDRLEVCRSSSMPVRTSPLSCINYDPRFDV